MRFVATLWTLLAAVAAHAADWPQWLGKNRDGATEEKVAPWKKPLKELWKVKVGEGHSGPIVADGKVFLHTRVPGNDVEELTAFSVEKGDVLWQKSYKRTKFSSIFGSGPRATPCFDSRRVYTHGVTGLLTCFDAAKGDMLWQIDTFKEFTASNLFFGVSTSPVVGGDKLLLNVGAKGA